MKRFRFALEPLLRHRALLERQAQATCALERARLHALHSRAELLQRYIAQQTPSPDTRAYFERIEWSSGELAHMRARIRAGEEAAEERTAEFAHARARHGVIRSLKRRRCAAYGAARTRADERDAEEIAWIRISRSVL